MEVKPIHSELVHESVRSRTDFNLVVEVECSVNSERDRDGEENEVRPKPKPALLPHQPSMATMAKPGAVTPLHSHLNELPLVDLISIRTKLKGSVSHFSYPNVTLKRLRNASILPVIRAQTSAEYFPDSKFYKVEAIVRPWRVQKVSSALLKMGIRGVTVSDVRGFGSQGGSTERQGGSEFSEDNFVAKVKMEIVVSKDQVEAVIDKIIEEARTGEIGDGKIFLVPVSDVIRIRTGERGEKAERMTGGRSDRLSPA